jgi:hypothetical protein
MSRTAPAIRFWLAAVLSSILLQSCAPAALSLGGSRTTPNAVATALSSPSPEPAVQATRTAPSAPAPTAPSPTSLPPQVTVTAINGNVFIRRGPDLAFNSISVLTKGQTVVATARDVLARWLQIPVPGDPQRTGWITIVTSYTSVTGDVQSLPELEQTTWPELASLRNCTHHLMTTDPGGIDIPAVDYFPDNEVRIDPGVYSILDLDVDKYPEVLSVDIREGSAIDILTDGTGEKKKCPLP